MLNVEINLRSILFCSIFDFKKDPHIFNLLHVYTLPVLFLDIARYLLICN